jgi:DNA-binding NarL/FixJ family response regulator
VKTEGGRGKAKGGRDAAVRGSAASVVGLSILLVGDTERSEFCEARACLERQGTVHRFADAESAAAALAEERILPDVMVVAQAFPGQFSHKAIDRLRRVAPLARVVGLMGSWCEGEMRSGSPWPATVRTYWHQWPARCGRQFRRLAMGQSCSWALPLTATEEERLLTDAAELGDTAGQASSAAPKCRGLVAIHSPSRVMADWLSTACRRDGFVTLLQRDLALGRVEGAAAGVFDAGDFSEDACCSLRRFVAALRPAAVVALLSFPRIEDHRRALSAGATAALSKPLMVDDFLVAIEACAV